MAFKFLHTADLHLDSPLKSLALRDPALADLVGTASRRCLRRITDLAIGENVQALIIAGDLYDGAQTSMKTARFLVQEMERLAEAKIPVFIIRGNHDAQSTITKELRFPDNVTVFSDHARAIDTTWNGHAITVHGLSFATPHAPETLLPQYAPARPDRFNIGIMHTSLGGAAGHDPYAPCSLAALQDTGYAYWALGHIHQRAEHLGATTVVMPGIPQGRDIGEAGEKSVSLVEVDDTGALSVMTRVVAEARFERIEVAIDGLADWGSVIDQLRQALHRARRDFPADHLILRPTLRGDSPLAWRLRRDADLLHQEAQSCAESIGSVWIDKVEMALDMPVAAAQGPVADLAGYLRPEALDGLMDAAQQELDRIWKKLPHDLRDWAGEDAREIQRMLREDMQQGAIDVIAELEEPTP